MIVTRIYGGLGNQLFQYAIGRKLSLLHNSDLILDVGMFEKYSLRNYELHNFNVCGVAESKRFNRAFNFFRIDKLNKLYNTIFNKNRVLYENSHCFDNVVQTIEITDIKYLVGYWQSEIYFKDIEDIIRHDLTLKTSVSDKVMLMKGLIMSHKFSVGLHIRKTDFISEKKNTLIFANCGVDYYSKAEKYILDFFKNEEIKPVFFIFSDDFEWVSLNLKLTSEYIFVNDFNKPHEDLYLMSLCKHNITANSTFSWWGAWLNPNPEKVIITPKRWFSNEMSDIHIVPTNWIRIDN